MAEAVRRGGAWIACRPGCCECCIGPFSISQSDAARLREGMARLDSAIAQRARDRARNYIAAIHSYDEDGLPEGMDDVACPALDPVTRNLQPLRRSPHHLPHLRPRRQNQRWRVATCDLCFKGASEEQIAACAVEIDRDSLELDAPAGDPRGFRASFLLTG